MREVLRAGPLPVRGAAEVSEPTPEQGRAAALAYAYGYTANQQAATSALVVQALAMWAALDMADPFGSWATSIGRRIYVALSILQQVAAANAARYVHDTLALQGLTYRGPNVNPANFAGIASDGRDLESLLAGAMVHLREEQAKGRTDEEAKAAGGNFLRMVLPTQVSDQARAAESVTLTAADARDASGRDVEVGWVRLLTPPSCGRCAVLAGRFYRWSDGFERHPMCDCRHLACSREAAAGLSDGPEAYFESLSEEQQNRLFGKANADAIRDGSDIGQVMNATTRPGAMFTADNGRRYTREGGTRRGLFGQSDVRQRKGRVLRPTPLQIYRDAGGDRAEAVRMLKQFRYLL